MARTRGVALGPVLAGAPAAHSGEVLKESRNTAEERQNGPNELAAVVEEVLETMCLTTVLAPPGLFGLNVPIKLARVVDTGFLGWEEVEEPDSRAGEVASELQPPANRTWKKRGCLNPCGRHDVGLQQAL